MKHVFLAVLIVAMCGVTTAQNTAIVDKIKTTVYVDTTLDGVLHATAAASAAAIARGFSDSTSLPATAINESNSAYIQWRFRGKASATGAAATSFTQDTVRVQGKLAPSTLSTDLDKIWVDIPLRWTIKATSSPGAGGFGQIRDTVATVFFPGTSGMTDADGYISPRFQLPKGYVAYRVVNGKADSGRVVIRTTLEQHVK